MSNRETLQSIWSMTDKPIIDIMTKSKHKSTAAGAKDDYSNKNSDSDSADSSSNGSFVAVPEEFRPNLTPHLRDKKVETSKVLYSQNFHKKPFTQNTNLTNETERDERFSRLLEKMSSIQKIKAPAKTSNCTVAAAATTEKTPNKIANNALPFLKQCASMTKSSNKNKGNKLQYEHNEMECEKLQLKTSSDFFDDSGRYLPPFLRKNKDETGRVPHSQNSKKTLIQNQKLTTESERSRRISRNLKTILPVRNTEGASKMPNHKFVRFSTSQEDTSKKMVTNFPKQCQTPISKTPKKEQLSKPQYEHIGIEQGNKLQYEYIGIEQETVQLNFELPSKGLKFEKKLFQQNEIVSKNDNLNSCFRMRQDNIERKYKTPIEENVVKWDSALNLNAENDSGHSEIEWTVIHEKKMYSFKKQNNECKFKNPNQMRKQPLRENSYHRKLKSSLQYETNFKEESNKDAIKSKELEYHSGTTFYENNLQLQNNSNCNDTKYRNCNTKPKQTISSNNSIDQSYLNALKENIQQEFKQNGELNYGGSSSSCTKVKETEEVKIILDYGKDISDLILGSHTTLSILISLYHEWRGSRQKLIEHFELLEKNLKESSQNFTIYRDIINVAYTGATLATAIPHPFVSIAARIVSALTGLFSTYLNNENIIDSNDITTSLFKDTQVSNELYMYGLQCNQQFEETNKVIEKFHSNIAERELFVMENQEIAKFVEGILEYRPTHCIFYKKVHKSFQELLQTATSSSAKKLCEPFLLGPPTAMDVIAHLDWRFQYENFNSEAVKYEVEQLHTMIQDSNTTSLKDLMQKVRNCIRILKDELAFVDRSIKHFSLLDISPSCYKG